MDLSILIPSRNEMFLRRTVEDILANMRGSTEIIAVLDGAWADPGIPDDPHVILIHYSESIGQRAATNVAAKISTAKYLIKCDAHCAFDEGFDVKLMEDMQDDWTVAPTMRNLHAFNWVCDKCGETRYQGPSGPCSKCGEPTRMDVVWIAKTNPQSNSYCFDSEPHFQYFNEYSHRPEGHGDLTESMSLQGSFFMATRQKYFELNLCDESLGSWGSQGIEVACKTWLSGGKVMINHKTWYAHMFRTQGGDFGFPYPLKESNVQEAKKKVRSQFFENKWEHQVHPLSWLVEKFWPIKGWTAENLAELKGEPVVKTSVEVVKEPGAVAGSVVYYTDNELDPVIIQASQNQLTRATGNIEIVSVSLKPIPFGQNIVLPLERGYLTMFKQILAGLEAATGDVVFLCEHDILYHPSHFNFLPPRKDVFYYNRNNWKVRYDDGQALFYTCEQTMGLCAYRELLLEHYRRRVARVESDGFNRSMGFEPGKHQLPNGVDSYGWDFYFSEYPNIDIRHDKNLTSSRWRQDQFRNQKNCQDWKMADDVPGWGVTKGRFKDLLGELG